MIQLVDLLNTFGAWLLASMMRLSLELTVLAAVVLAVIYVLKVRSPRLRHLFWCLVLAKPVVTFVIASPISLYWFLHPVKVALAPPAPRVAVVRPMEANYGPRTMAYRPMPRNVPAPEPAPVPPWWAGMRADGVVAVLWLAGAALLALRLVFGFAFVSFLRRTAVPQDEGPLADIAESARATLGLRRRTVVALSQVVHGPVLAGVLRPAVLLPGRIMEQCTPQQVELVVAHELAHARRMDNLALLVQRLAEVVLFFHPVVWLCGWVMRRESESACDYAVIEAYSAAARADQSILYADSLTRVAEMRSGITRRLLINTFAAVESNLAGRVRRIIDGRLSRRTLAWTLASVGALVAVALVGLPTATGPTDKTQKTAPALAGAGQGVTAMKTTGQELRYGFRYDPMRYVESDTSVPAALVRAQVFGKPRAGDDKVIADYVAEILAKQRPDGSFADKSGDTGRSLTWLAVEGVGTERPEFVRGYEAMMHQREAEAAAGAPGDYKQPGLVLVPVNGLRAACMTKLVTRPEVRFTVRWLADHPDVWLDKTCPWGGTFVLRALWHARGTEDVDAGIKAALAWLDKEMNDAGCVKYWDPYAVMAAVGTVDMPEARAILLRQVPMLLRGQETNGAWGANKWDLQTLDAFRALKTHGLLDKLRALPPLPPDWRVVRSIPAPDGNLGWMTYQAGRLWVHNYENGEIIGISPQDGSVVKRLKVPGVFPVGLGQWDGSLAVSQKDSGKRVVKVNPDTGAIEAEFPIPFVADPMCATMVAGKLWIADSWLFPGWVVDPAHPENVPSSDPNVDWDPALRLERLQAGTCPNGIAVLGDGVWQTDYFARAMIKSGPDGKLTDWAERPFGGWPPDIAYDGRNLWALDAPNKRISIIEKTESGAALMQPASKVVAVAAAPSPSVKREGGKVLIEGLEGAKWGGESPQQDTVIGAMTAVAQLLGPRDATYDYVSGVSGSAFRVQIGAEGWRIEAPFGIIGFDESRPAASALGWALEWSRTDPKDAAAVKTRNDAIVRSIDAGWPVLLAREECSIIVGYEDGGKSLIIRQVGAGQPGYVPLKEEIAAWHAVGIIQRAEVSPWPPFVAAMKSRGFACALWQMPDVRGYAEGKRAYELWAQRLEDDAYYADAKKAGEACQCNGYAYCCLDTARAAAAAYLPWAARQLDGTAADADHVRKAAALYQQVVDTLRRKRDDLPQPWMLFPWDLAKTGGWTQAQRHAQAAVLREVAALEEKAVAELILALKAEGVATAQVTADAVDVLSTQRFTLKGCQYEVRPVTPEGLADLPRVATGTRTRSTVYPGDLDVLYNIHCQLLPADQQDLPARFKQNGDQWQQYWQELGRGLAGKTDCFALAAYSEGELAGYVRFFPSDVARMDWLPSEGVATGRTLVIGAAVVDSPGAEHGLDAELVRRTIQYARRGAYTRIIAFAWSNVQPFATWGESFPVAVYDGLSFQRLSTQPLPADAFADMVAGAHGTKVRDLTRAALERMGKDEDALKGYVVRLDLTSAERSVATETVGAAKPDYSKLSLKGDGHVQDSFTLTIQAADRMFGRATDYGDVYALSSNCFAPAVNLGESCTSWWHVYGDSQGREMDAVAAAVGLRVEKLAVVGYNGPDEPGPTEAYQKERAATVRAALDAGAVVITQHGWEVRNQQGLAPWCWWGIITSAKPENLDSALRGACLAANPGQAHGYTDRIVWPHRAWALYPAETSLTGRAAVLTALTNAVARVRGAGAFAAEGDYRYGLDAMDAWIGRMEKVPVCEPCFKSDPSRVWSCAMDNGHTTTAASQAAAAWLRKSAGSLSGAARPRLEAAAAHYDRIVALLAPAVTGVGGESYQQFIGDLAKQKTHADVLRQVKAELSAAADEMAAALKAENVEVAEAPGALAVSGGKPVHGELKLSGDLWTQETFSLALAAAARSFGRQASYEDICARSGQSFAPGFDTGNDCKELMVCQGWVGHQCPMAQAAASVGLELEPLPLPRYTGDAKDEAARKANYAACAKVIAAALARGDAVITSGGWENTDAHPVEPWLAGLITEVGSDGAVLGLHLTGGPGCKLASLDAGEVFAVRPAPKAADMADVNRQMLEHAVLRIRAQGSYSKGQFTAFGADAMDEWIRLMQDVRWFCPPCQQNNGSGWKAAAKVARSWTDRSRAAAAYLRRIAPDAPAAAGAHLTAAASHYDRMIQLLTPALTGQGGESYQQFIGDLAKQKAHADVLRQVKAELAAAADEMAAALATQGISVPTVVTVPTSEGVAPVVAGKKHMLPGLECAQMTSAELSAVEGALRYLGKDVSPAWLYGATGHAFAINMRPTVCVSSPYAWKKTLYELAPNVGCRITGICVSMQEAGDAFPARQREAWDMVRAAVDRGLPCYADRVSWMPDYSLITGYDDVGYYYTHANAGARGGPTPWQKLGTDDIQVLDVWRVEPCEPKPDDETVRAALQTVLAHAATPDGWVISDGHRSGPWAFDLWADELELGHAKLDDHTWNAHFWYEARLMAVDFLKEAKRRLPGRADAAFDEAVAHYTVVRDKLAAVKDLNPFRDNSDWTTLLKSPEQARLVREAGAAERLGLASLAKVLVALGGTLPAQPTVGEEPAKGSGIRFVLGGVRKVAYHTDAWRFTPFCNALSAALEYLGEPEQYDYLMCTSGAAFRMRWTSKAWDGGNSDILGTAAETLEPMRRAFRSAGYQMLPVAKAKPADWAEDLFHDEAKRLGGELTDEAGFRRNIIHSINSGRPVIAFGIIGPPEACVITGYDERGDVLTGWNVFQDDEKAETEKPSGYFRVRDWYAKTRGLLLIGEKVGKPDAKELDLDTLKWTLQVLRTPRVNKSEAGPAAFDAWAADMLNDEYFPKDKLDVLRARLMCHWDSMTVTAFRGGNSVTPYLTAVAGRQPAMAAELKAAANCFENEDVVHGVAPGEEAQMAKLADPAVRRKVADSILHAHDMHTEAADHVEKALLAAGVPPADIPHPVLQAAVEVTDRDQRVVLEKVPKVGYGVVDGNVAMTPFPACLKACLEYMGDDLGFAATAGKYPRDAVYAYLMGTTGAAFRLLWGPGWRGDNVASFAIYDDAGEIFRRGFAAAGYSVEVLHRGAEAPFRDRVLTSIRDRGRPVIVHGPIGPPEETVIAGYDEGGRVAIGWSFFQNRAIGTAGVEFEPNGMFRKRNWEVDTWSMLVIGDKGKTPERKQTYTDALRNALHIMRDPVRGGKSNGIAAYDAWADHILKDDEVAAGGKPDDAFIVHCDAADVVAEGRYYASVFLKQAADVLPEAKDELLAAADCCKAEHDLVWKIWGQVGSNVPSEATRKEFLKPDVRRRIVPLIRQARDKDAEAAGHIEKALLTLGVPAKDIAPVQTAGPAAVPEAPSGKTMLAGLKFPKWTITQLGCMSACLDYLGRSVPRAWLYGGTAQAFFINIHEDVDLESVTAWDQDSVLKLAPNLGFRVEGSLVKKPEVSEEAWRVAQQEAWQFVRRSILLGRPCYGWELKAPYGDYWLITGFDDTGYYYDGWETGGPTPWRKLGEQFIPVLNVRSVHLCESASDEVVVRDALVAALAHAKPGWDKTADKDAHFGPEAFDVWAKALESGAALHNHHAYNAGAWHECREMAVEFLKEAKKRLPGRADAAFDQAIASYTVVRDKLAAVKDLTPVDDKLGWGAEPKLKSPEAAKLVREAGAAERDGLKALAAIAGALGGPAGEVVQSGGGGNDTNKETTVASKVKRDGDSVTVEGLPAVSWGSSCDTTFAGAMEAALAVTDHPYTATQIMGYTGLAFRVRWAADPEHSGTATWCPSIPVGEQPEAQDAVGRATGWQFRQINEMDRADAKQDTQMGRYADDIAASVEAGVPVVGYPTTDDLNPAVAYGYEGAGADRKFRWLTYWSGKQGKLIPAGDTGPWLMVPRSFAGAPDARKRLLDSLTTAVRNWRQRTTAEANGYQYALGEYAFERWRADLARAATFSQDMQKQLFFVTWWNFEIWQDARTRAAEFLKDEAPALGPDGRAAVLRAAVLYEREAKLLVDQISKGEAFLGPWGKKGLADWTPAVRAREQQVLAEALALEQQAIAEIEAALTAEGVAVVQPSTADEVHVIRGVPKLAWGGLDTYTDDLMVASALRMCLDQMGQKYTKAYLAGTSGAAFETGWAAGTLHSGGGGAVLAHPNHFEAGIENLSKAVGRECTIVLRSDRQRLWDTAVASIDAGRPVISSEWQVDHFVVLAGYDPAKMEFLGRRYTGQSEAAEEYVRIAPDELAFVIAFGPETQKSSPRDAALGALRFAVESAHTGRNTTAKGQGGTSHGMIYGPAAYGEYARLVPEQLAPALGSYALREHFMYWTLDALQISRAYAVLYLQEIAPAMAAPERQHMKEALAAYGQMLQMLTSDNAPLDRLGISGMHAADPHVAIIYGPPAAGLDNPLFWCQGGKQQPIRELLSTAAGRERFAKWLLDVGELDRLANNALARTVGEEELPPASTGPADLTRRAGQSTAGANPAAGVKRDDGKVWIAGMEDVNWGGSFFAREDSQARCLVEALHCAGQDVTYADVMGLSGAAFKLTMAPNLWVGEIHSEMGMDWKEIVSRVWGLDYDWQAISMRDEENPNWREQLRQATAESLGRGMPLFYMNGEWNLLVGYREDGSAFVCKPYAGENPVYTESKIPGGFLGDAWCASVLRPAGKPADRRDSVLNSLRTAVELSSHAPKADGSELFGFAAYDAWIAALETDRKDASKHGNAFSYSQLLTSRQAGAEYLRKVASELGAGAAGHLRTAADRYEAIAKRLDAGKDCVMWPWEQNWTPENRAKEAGILRQSLADERAAVAEIGAALAAEGVAVPPAARGGGGAGLAGVSLADCPVPDKVGSSSLPRAMAVALKQAGTDVSFSDMVAGSGWAFGFDYNYGNWHVAALSVDQFSWLPEQLGYRFDSVGWADRDRAWELIKSNVDAGTPVVTTLGDGGLITAYRESDGKREFNFDGVPGAGWRDVATTHPLDRCAIALKAGAPKDRAQIMRASLPRALKAAQQAQSALDAYLADVQDPSKDFADQTEWFCWATFEHLTARACCAAWLRSAADAINGDARKPLLAAADAYDRAFQKYCDYNAQVSAALGTSGNAKDKLRTPAAIAALSSALKAGMAEERAAVAQLAAAVAAIGGGTGTVSAQASGVMLDKLVARPRWASHMGAIGGCMDFLGRPVSDGWLYGTTAYAFALNIERGMCPSAPYVWMDDEQSRLGRNAGYTMQRVASISKEDIPEKRRAAWDMVRKALDAGTPCFAYDLEFGDYFVVNGYDATGYYYRAMGSNQSRGPLPWDKLGTTGNVGIVLVTALTLSPPADDRTAVMDALRSAVAMQRRGASGNYMPGIGGYDVWVAALERAPRVGTDGPDGVSPHGACFNAQFWAECRRNAVGFLKEAKGRLKDEKLDPLFDEAVADYQVVADKLGEVAGTFPMDDKRETRTKDAALCARAIAALKAAREAEAKGLLVLARIAGEPLTLAELAERKPVLPRA